MLGLYRFGGGDMSLPSGAGRISPGPGGGIKGGINPNGGGKNGGGGRPDINGGGGAFGDSTRIGDGAVMLRSAGGGTGPGIRPSTTKKKSEINSTVQNQQSRENLTSRANAPVNEHGQLAAQRAGLVAGLLETALGLAGRQPGVVRLCLQLRVLRLVGRVQRLDFGA